MWALGLQMLHIALIIIFWVLIIYLYKRNNAKTKFVPETSLATKSELVTSDKLNCPGCKADLTISKLLHSSYCFGGNAIVFDCKNCQGKFYYYPQSGFIELGLLGCSPVIDPIPIYRYKYSLIMSRKNQIININFDNGVYKIPSSILKKDGLNMEFSEC